MYSRRSSFRTGMPVTSDSHSREHPLWFSTSRIRRATRAAKARFGCGFIVLPCCVSDESWKFGGTPSCRLSRNTCRLARSGEPVKGSPQGSPEGTRSALDGIGSGVQPRNAGTYDSPTPQSGTWGRNRARDQPSVEASNCVLLAAAGVELDAGLRVVRRRVRAFLSGSVNPILRSSSADHPAFRAAE